MLEKLGARIRKIRTEEFKMSLADVKDETGMSRQTISYLERGARSGQLLIVYLAWLRKKGVDLNKLFD